MKRLFPVILIIGSVAFLAMSIPFILNSSLYTPDDTSPTLYHQNPLTSIRYSSERSEDVQSLQEFLDAPLPIVINIKLKNFADAKEDFEEYKIKSRQLNDAVNTFNLTETTIGNFNRENQKNIVALGKMISDSEEFDEVNRLGVLYQYQENPAFFYSLSYKGESILTSLLRTITEFRGRESDMLEISRELSLNTSRFQEVESILDEIINENRKYQEERGMNLQDFRQSSISLTESQIVQQERELTRPDYYSGSSISLTVSPTSGRYGDTLQLTGTYLSASLPEVTLFVDGSEWGVLQSDRSGVFSTPFTIGRMRSGKHVAFANAGTLYSNLATFVVIPAATELTFEANHGDRPSEIFCSGTLYAGEIPVTDAIVRILVDNFEAEAVRTNQTGFYSISIRLPEGNHTLQAFFDETVFPLESSESEVQTVVIKASSVPTPIAQGIGAGVIILGFLGGISYLIGFKYTGWMKRKPGMAGTKGIRQEPAESPLRFPAIRDILIRYLRREKGKPESTAGEMSGQEEPIREPAESSPRFPSLRDILIRYLRWEKGEPESTAGEMSGQEEPIQEPAESSSRFPSLRDILIRYLRREKGEPESIPQVMSGQEEPLQEPSEFSPGPPVFRDVLIRYLRQEKGKPESTPGEMSGQEEPAQEPAESSPGLPEDILIRYQTLLDSGEWSEAAFLLYQWLIRWLVPIHGISNPSALTPREFAGMLSSSSVGVALQSFIVRYEEVRYQGLPLQQDDILLACLQEVLAAFEVELHTMKGRDQ